MRELILRIRENCEDAEVLFNDSVKLEQKEKNISLEKLQQIIVNILSVGIDESDFSKIRCKPVEASVIGLAIQGHISRYIIKQPEHERFITLSVGDFNKAYKINFPASIYSVVVMGDTINQVEAYMYLEDKGMDTELYRYAMPNMLTGDKICIGKAIKEVSDDGIIQTLENIIYAPYSHEVLNNIKGFSNTISYFEYLKKNRIEEKYLYKKNLLLKEIF